MQRNFAAVVDDRLRSLDHQLDLQRSVRQLCLLFQNLEQSDAGAYMLRQLDLGNSDHEVLRKFAACLGNERGDENVKRAKTSRPQVFIERFEADADKRRQRVLAQSAGNFQRAGSSMPVLFGVGAISISILEIEAEIFNRFAA